jgi:hypothetical protein
MNARRIQNLAALAAAFAACAGVTDAAVELAPRSPFVPAGSPVPVAPVEGGVIELSGIIDGGANGPRFGITETETKKSRWVGLNEMGDGYVVRSYSNVGGRDEVVVEYQGRRLTLGLKKSRVATLRGPAAALSTAANPAANAALTRPVTTSPTRESEQARLEAVAAELERRRELRANATSGQ